MKLQAALIGSTLALALLSACGGPPKEAWFAPRPAQTLGLPMYLGASHLFLTGEQLFAFRRSDGSLAAAWPADSTEFIDRAAASPDHVAVRQGGKVSVLECAGFTVLAEEAADSGPYEAGGKLYWGQGSLVRVWDGAQGASTVVDMGAGHVLYSAAQGEGLLLLGARRLSAMQVTLNRGLVIGGSLIALGEDGTERWRFDELPAHAPLIHQGTAYFANNDVLVVQLCAVDLANGALRWKRGFGNMPSDPAKARRQGFTIPETPTLGRPFVLEGALVLGVNDGDGQRVLALEPGDGSERWAWRPMSDVVKGVGDHGAAFSNPVLAGDKVLLGVGAFARALTSRGKPAWAIRSDSPVRPVPVADAAGFAVSSLKQIHYFDLSIKP